MTSSTSQGRRSKWPPDRRTSAPVKLAGFAAILAVLFGAAALAGGAVDPDRGEPRTRHSDDATASSGGHGDVDTHASAPVADGEAEAAHGDAREAAHPVRGLAVAENGLRLVVEDRELGRGQSTNVGFRIVDERNETVRDFDVEHTKRMHVIVVRRDLGAFAHLHPEQHRDGSWSVRVRLPMAGSYRLFADFTHEGRPATLADDLHVDGRADLRALPAPAASVRSDGGYDVRLDAGRAGPGEEAALRFTIAKNGQTVKTEPYLGAGGHLVALRDGDLAFLHVHPTEPGERAEKAGTHDDPISFAATFPTAGRYRLFLQFEHQGVVRTVAFTREVR